MVQTAFLVLIFSFSGHAQEKTLSVISNVKGAPDEMTNAELKSILKGEKQRWSNSVPVVIALMKSTTDAGRGISKKIFEMDVDEFNKYWLALVFQGKAKAPYFFHSASELETFVTETPGAIGVIETPPSAKIRQISIDGKKSF
ncbi:MAG: hypothetical protein ABIT08_04035 [Bacteroidia bacterium]